MKKKKEKETNKVRRRNKEGRKKEENDVQNILHSLEEEWQDRSVDQREIQRNWDLPISEWHLKENQMREGEEKKEEEEEEKYEKEGDEA